MEAIIVILVAHLVPHWSVILFVAASLLALLDVAIVGCVMAYGVARALVWAGFGATPHKPDSLDAYTR